jgi:hypothetical protein
MLSNILIFSASTHTLSNILTASAGFALHEVSDDKIIQSTYSFTKFDISPISHMEGKREDTIEFNTLHEIRTGFMYS